MRVQSGPPRPPAARIRRMDIDPTRVSRPPEETVADDAPGGVPRRIGKVELGKQLGAGGMAGVYIGLDHGFTPPRQVAVKLMDQALGGNDEFRQRFEREASLVGGFRHDSVVHVYASGETATGMKYIVMEYLAGGTLSERVKAGALPADEALDIAATMADALAYSHARGVVHRDFKPGNILFTAEGKPVLSDFGVAKVWTASEAALTRHAMSIGAPRYMAPEQDRAEEVTDRADIYALGITLVELLTGQIIPARLRIMRDDALVADMRAVLPPEVPAGVAELICRCLQFDPAQRPSAAQARELLRMERRVLLLARDAPAKPVASAKAGKPVALPWIAGTAVLAVLLGSVYMLRDKKPEAAAQAGSTAAASTTATPVVEPSPPALPSFAEFERFDRFTEPDYALSEADLAAVPHKALQDVLRYQWLQRSGDGPGASALKRQVDEREAAGDPRAAVTALLIDALAAGGLRQSLVGAPLRAASAGGDAMASFFWAGALRAELGDSIVAGDAVHVELCRLLRLSRDQGWTEVASRTMAASQCPRR
jgi:hypothetical protein